MPTTAPPPLQDAATFRGSQATRRIELPLLAIVPGLVHFITVKGSDARAALAEAAGRTLPLLSLKQVHGATVRVLEGPAVSPSAAPPIPEEGDALVVRGPGAAACVWVADCAPVLIGDDRTRTAAAVHAGWRGVVAGVVAAALSVLRDASGARGADVRIAIGPCIGPCCFEVGDEVVEALLRAHPDASDCVLQGPKRRVDLAGAVRRQAMEAGVPPDRIQASGLCTACRPDLLESHRRERGAAGRMAGVIAWRE